MFCAIIKMDCTIYPYLLNLTIYFLPVTGFPLESVTVTEMGARGVKLPQIFPLTDWTSWHHMSQISSKSTNPI